MVQVGCMRGIWAPLVSPWADLRQSRLTAAVRRRATCTLRTATPSAAAQPHHDSRVENCCLRSVLAVLNFLFTLDTPVICSKSRGRGAITCSDAPARPGTHSASPRFASEWESAVNTSSSGGSSKGAEGDRLERWRMTEARRRQGSGRQEAGEVQVIVRSDSGGQCQASFRIRSLRSSCYIFYWRNKRMACNFHMRAIFLRVASRGTTGECVWEKQNSSLRNAEKANMQLITRRSVLVVCSAGSHPVIVWVKSHLRWIARRVVSPTPRQINNQDPILFLQWSSSLENTLLAHLFSLSFT